jgi:hypothetical protein
MYLGKKTAKAKGGVLKSTDDALKSCIILVGKETA